MKLPWKLYPRRDGSSLLTVLVASSLLLMLGMTVAGTAFHHLSMSNRLNHAQAARNLAEGAIAQAIAELMKEHTKYQGAGLAGFKPVPNISAPVDERGILTFDPAELPGINSALHTLRLEKSFNNFGSDATVTVNGRTLPGESAYLQAIGVDHGVERSVECVIYIPKYPWAMASAGPIKLAGQSHVASVKDMADINDPTKELPGHLVTNSDIGANAILFEGDKVSITGDAQSASGGKADVSGTAQPLNQFVKGEVRLNRQAAAIPQIKIQDYDTSTKTGVTTFTSSAGPNQVDGFAYRDGDLNFPAGLTLNGVLYVKGNITVNGQISGDGAIISTQNINVDAAGQLASNNKVAVMSGGDLTLQGSGTDRLSVSGLVYAEGKLKADYTNIYGNTVAPGGGGMDLKDVNISQLSQLSDMEFTVGGGTPATFPFAQAPLPTLRVVGPPNGLDTYDIGITANVTAPPARFFDATTQKYVLRTDLQFLFAPTVQNPGGTTAAYAADGITHLPQGIYTTQLAPPGGPQMYYQVPSPERLAPLPPLPAPLSPADITVYIGGTAVPANQGNMISLAQQYAVDNINQQRQNQGLPLLTGPQELLIRNTVARNLGPALIDSTMFANSNTAIKAVAEQMGHLTPGGASETIKISLNGEDHMSRFISRAESIRVLYWRETP